MEEKKENKQTKQNPINPGLILIILIVVVLGFFYFRQGQLPKTNPKTNQTQQSGNQTNQNKTGVIESIKDALTKNLSFKCQYQPEGANEVVTMFFKGGKIRSELSSENEIKNIAIVDDKKAWNWQPKEKKGVVFSIDLFRGKEVSDNQSFDQEEMIKEAEKYRQNCKVENFSDSLFNPPADIEFQNMDEMMKGMTQE